LGEKSLDWSDSLEEVLLELDFDNISSLSSKIGELISWVYDAADKHSLDGVHEDLGILDLLLDEVAVPGSDAVVVDGDALV
jgi:hypothetical protein